MTESEFWYMYAPKRALKANQFFVIENMKRLNLLISHEYVFDIYFLFHPKNNLNDREVTMKKLKSIINNIKGSGSDQRYFVWHLVYMLDVTVISTWDTILYFRISQKDTQIFRSIFNDFKPGGVHQ